MNLIVVFLKPSLSVILDNSLRELAKIPDGKSDILIGPLPLLPAFVSPTFQQTIPYDYTAAKWLFPCPKPVARIEMAMMTYQLTVWLTMATVLVLTAILLLDLANWQRSSLMDLRTFQTLSYWLYNACPLSVGISATNKPNT